MVNQFGVMELNTGCSHSNEKETFKQFSSAIEEKMPADKDMKTSVFVNHAANFWHESRRKWVGKQSRRPQQMAKDPIISYSNIVRGITARIFCCSWSTAYEDLLSTNEPFSEPIPLPEMVDFLVDIWQDEGLFD